MKTRSTPLLEDLAERALPELKKVAQKGETITYGELADKVNTHHYYVLPKVLGQIWNWCDINGYPHINALVVNQETGVPGESYQPANRPTTMKKWDALWKEIHQFDWRRIDFN